MRYSGLAACPIMVLLLVIVSLVASPIPLVSSQVSAAVAVAPSTVSVHMGEAFIATLDLSNVQNLYGLEVVLNWDPAVLRVVNVDVRLGVETFSDGVLHESSSSPSIFIAENNLTQTKGEYQLTATSMGSAPSFSGDGNIVRITFEPIALGESLLDLESQLYDYPPLDRDPRISFPIDHLTHDSFVAVKASNSATTPIESTPPEIMVLSPVNQAYNESSVHLIFTVNKLFNWVGYSLDGKETVTVMDNVTLTDLSNGLHNVTVYANDTFGNMGVSETLSFTVATPSLVSEPFPIVPVAAVIVVVVAAGAGLLLYFKRRRHVIDV
jgi:hypothetical protein